MHRRRMGGNGLGCHKRGKMASFFSDWEKVIKAMPCLDIERPITSPDAPWRCTDCEEDHLYKFLIQPSLRCPMCHGARTVPK